MKKIFPFIVTVILISSCNPKKSFTLKGTLPGSPAEYVYLSKVDINTPLLIDSAKIGKNGNFRLKVDASEADFYQLGVSDAEYITLLAEPGEKIHLNFEGEDLFGKYTVSGSKGSSLVQTLDNRLQETKRRLDSLSAVYDKALKESDFETKSAVLEEAYLDIMKQQRKFNIEFIIKNINSLASVKALYQKTNDQLYVLYEQRDLQYLKIVADSLKRHYPNSKHTKALVSDLENEMNQLYSRQIEALANSLPETKLDPSLTDVNGKRVTLSSLKGKYVLLAFWASESRDCIAENLQLKEFYKLYSKKGFEIYQISLDKDETAWKTSVKFDELPWINTREDDPSNPYNARIYNVKTLPANYLYDPNGNIIAQNLHGRSLQLKLDQLFLN
jgi:thiol-disulfide isomerase/thioredoxin